MSRKLTRSAISGTSMAGSTLILDKQMRKISSLPGRSGGPTYTKRSSRPGRIRAESWSQSVPSVIEDFLGMVTHDHFRSVGRSHDRNAERFLHTVHFVQKGCKHALV